LVTPLVSGFKRIHPNFSLHAYPVTALSVTWTAVPLVVLKFICVYVEQSALPQSFAYLYVASIVPSVMEAETRPSSPYGHFLTISRGATSLKALGYVHMNIGTNPRTGLDWTCGDAVLKGDPLGTVAINTFFYEHIHLEMDNNSDGFTNCLPGATSIAALDGDPLLILSPVGDSAKPVSSSAQRAEKKRSSA